MKKSLLALAVAAVAASTAASAATVYDKDGSSLDVYGRVQGVMYSTHAAKYNSYDDSSLQATGRLGLNMRTNLTSGIDAFANMEWDVADKTDSFKARYAFLGVDFGSYGVVKAGRFEDAVKYVIGATDIFDDWGCNGQFDSDKRDGMFMYSWSGYGVDANLSVQTAQNEQDVAGHYRAHLDGVAPNQNWVKANVGSLDVNTAVAASLGYTSPAVLFGPISVKAGYSYIETQADDVSENTPANKNGAKNIEDIDSWAVSASWGNLSDGLYLAALYNERVFNGKDKTKDLEGKGAEAVIAYSFANGVSLRTGWNFKKFDNGEASVKAHTIPVYANYQVNPLFNVWAEARFDAGTDDGHIKNFADVTGDNYVENVYSVGARYTF